MGLEAAFERDLRAWMRRVYEIRTSMVRRRVDERLGRVLEGERRWLIPLTAGVWLGVAVMPALGIAGVVGTLVLLYVGAITSGYVTMRKAEQVESERPRDPRAESEALTAWAWTARPPLGQDERVHLVRIMNLARASHHPGVRPALLDEVREARGVGNLSTWAFMDDLDELLRQDAGALA